MRLLLLAAAASLALGACGAQTGATAGADVTLLNVSYDPTRELYEAFNADFAAHYRVSAGKSVKVNMSHGGSGKQARSVVDGLDADVVTLALESDIDLIATQTGKLATDWRASLPANSSPYTSTIVFLVRKGNPKAIRDWSDLARPGVAVVTPNPKTSGGARWSYLAAWASGMRQFAGDEDKTKAFVRAIYANAAKLDTGARAATTTFTQQGTGDVLVTWENEALYTLAEQPSEAYELVYPQLSIRAEPPVAVVRANAQKHGVLQVAEDYLRYLYSPAGQKIAARHYYRPNDPSAAEPADMARFRPVEMVTVDDPMFGGWARAQAKHFEAGALFDQIYQPAR